MPDSLRAWASTPVHGGVLRSSVLAANGHFGQALVTWRSPVFVAPPLAGAATLSLALASASAWTPAATTTPTFSVRLLDLGGGPTQTLIDSNPVPTADEGWGASSRVELAPNTVPAGAALRLEIAIRVPLAGQSGGATIDLDDVTIAITQPADAITSAGTSNGTVGPPSPATIGASASPAPAGAGAPLVAPEASADEAPVEVDATCPARDVAVVGAAGLGRRLSIVGTAQAKAGSRVDLLSIDGWLLGRTVIDAGGQFAARVREPRGSAGTSKVFARLGDGRRSDATTVAHRNELRGVLRTPRGLIVDGAVAPSIARRGHVAVDVELPAGNPCGRPVIVHGSQVVVDRRTGKYRALVPMETVRGTGRGAGGPVVGRPTFVRTRVIRSGSGLPRLIVRSQMILGPKSDRRGT